MNKKIKSKLGKLLLILGVAATVGSGIRFGPQKNEPPKVVKVESNLRTQERQERTYDTSFELNKNDRESSKKSINIGIDNDYVLKYRTKTDPGQVLEERQACFKQLIEELEAKKNAYEKVLSDDEIESLTSNTEQIILAKEVPNSGELVFWRKVRDIIRQNKKGALLQFLFESTDGIGNGTENAYGGSNPTLDQQLSSLKETMEALQQQVDSLQQKLIELKKNQTLNLKHALSELLNRSQATKIDQLGDSSLNPQSPNLISNDSEVRNPTYQRKGMESKSVSDDSKSDSRALSNSERYNLPSNQDSGLNETNFITLGKISEEEKIEIIQTGFQRQAEGIISLKKYYESTDPNSLFQLKGYSIKYETIRRTQFYQNLK